MAGGEQLVGNFLVTLQSLGLVERTLVGIQIQPVHGVENRLHGLVGGTLAIGVLDAQDEFTAATARFEPAIKRSARTADVQETGGAGGEAGAYGHRDIGSEGEAADFNRSATPVRA